MTLLTYKALGTKRARLLNLLFWECACCECCSCDGKLKMDQYIKHTSSCDAQEIITKGKRLKLAFGIFKF